MNRFAATVFLTLTSATVAAAQGAPAPFDMSRERPPTAALPAPQLSPSVAPAETQPSAPVGGPGSQSALPFQAPPRQIPIVVQSPLSKTEAAPRATVALPPAQSLQASPPQAGEIRRFVVPDSELPLQGEYDRRSWSIYLTPDQLATRATFHLAYQNAIVVAPEASYITVFLNNRVVGQQHVGSPDGPSNIAFAVPTGVLQPGANLVTIEATQRHRTDCSIQSTYDLWSNIQSAGTYLSFTGAPSANLSTTDAIRAVGVDETGKTQFDFVVPALGQPGATRSLLRLAQGLAVLSGMPNERMSFTPHLPKPGAGHLAVLVGTAAELQPLFPNLPPGAQSAAIASLVTDTRTGALTLLVSGPSWTAIGSAIDTIVTSTDRPPELRRDAIATSRWIAPDAPLVFGDTHLTFAQLGVATKEFSGRRFRTAFQVAVPSDFYANAYGEATVLLDAAYTKDVMPGSHIDIYVNGNIASTVPITTNQGGIMRHLPIRVTMRHFKPGVNAMAIEAVLLSRDDTICAPGATAATTSRFALFDTSELHMPDFARVGQSPNLSATVGTGYPYSRSPDPTALFMDHIDADTLSATATLLGQMAQAAGHSLAVDPVAAPSAIGDRNALLIGAISQMSPTTLAQLNIAATSQTTWRPVANGQASTTDTGATFEQWRSKVSGGVWQGQISAFQEWLRRNFDITRGSLQFLPSSDEIYAPPNTASLMIAQGIGPDGGGSWTLVTAPTSDDLREGVNAVTTRAEWPKIEGHIATYAAKSGKIDIVPVTRVSLVASQPWSILNFRLIAANWLSTNVLSYASLLVALSLVIGAVTRAMLARLGRSK